MLPPWKKIYDKPRHHIKKQRHHFANKSVYSQSYGVSSSHVRMWKLDHRGGGAPNSCFQIVVLQSPLDSKEIKPVHPKGYQSWKFTGRTDAEGEALMLWSPDEKSLLTGKDPDAGIDWGQEEKGMTEDEMVGWPHQLNGYEFQQTPGGSEGQGSLACYSPLRHRVGHDWVSEHHWSVASELCLPP